MTSQSEWLRYGTIAQLCQGDVLDLICNKGELAIAIAIFGFNSFGVDLEEVNIDAARERARELGLGCRFGVRSEVDQDLPPDFFDTVVIDVVDKAYNYNSWFTLIRQAVRVCGKEGRIVFSVGLGEQQNTIESLINDLGVEWGLGPITWKKEEGNNYSIGCVRCLKSAQFTKNSRINAVLDSVFLKPLELAPIDLSEKVSIIIPTYNRAHYLLGSLESVLNQSYPNTEVIVVNDGSTDNTDEIIRPYLHRICYIKKVNGGKSTALNIGLRHATGKYIWIFDDDDIALPRKLEIDIRFLQRHPSIDVVHSYGYRMKNETGGFFSVYMSRIKKPEETIECLLLWPQILNISMLVKKSCYDCVGSYREDFVRCQDYEMWFRLARHFNIQLLNCATVIARIHSEERGNQFERFQSPKECFRYDQKLFSEIYETSPLADFYPALKDSPDSPVCQIEALLARIRIMSMRHLYHLVQRDLVHIANKVKSSRMAIEHSFVDRFLTNWQQNLMGKNYAYRELLALMACFVSLSIYAENRIDIASYSLRVCWWSLQKHLLLRNWRYCSQMFMVFCGISIVIVRHRLLRNVS